MNNSWSCIYVCNKTVCMRVVFIVFTCVCKPLLQLVSHFSKLPTCPISWQQPDVPDWLWMGGLPPPLSLALLLSCSRSLASPLLTFFPFTSPSPSLHAHGRPLLLYHFSVPFSVSTTLSTDFPVPWINPTLYNTIMWLNPQGKVMPWHPPTKAPLSPQLTTHPATYSFFLLIF